MKGTCLLISVTVMAVTISVAGSNNTHCGSCVCKRARMPEIRAFRARIANCSGVGIVQVPSGLPSDISVLDISYNELLKTLRQSDLAPYSELKSLVMKGNAMVLEGTVFKNITKVELMDFTASKFTELPLDVFSGLHKLRKIIGLHVGTVKEGIFNGLERLSDVTLTVENDTLPEMLFKDLTLHRIELTVPNCESLPEKLFANGATSLRTLKIVGNNLTAFPEQLFKGLSLLHDVTLEADKVHALPKHMLHGPHDTPSLNLDNMDDLEASQLMYQVILSRLAGERDSVVQLQRLTLLGIDTIGDHVLGELGNLETLLIKRPLEIEANAFSDLPSLDHLELSYFNVTDLNENWFKDFSSLKALNLSSNNIAHIDGGVFNGLQSLVTLDLSHNNISYFEASALNPFRNYIEILDLSFNNICELPPSVFMSMYTLRKLILESNCLKAFPPGLFADSSSYDYDISSYSETETYFFQAMKDMEEINLRNNQIEQISFYVFNQMGYLKIVDLSNNTIQNVYVATIPDGTNMEKIDFTNNPLNCTCGLVDLVRLAVDSGAEILGTCAMPSFLQGVSLIDLVNYTTYCEPVTQPAYESTTQLQTTQRMTTQVETETVGFQSVTNMSTVGKEVSEYATDGATISEKEIDLFPTTDFSDHTTLGSSQATAIGEQTKDMTKITYEHKDSSKDNNPYKLNHKLNAKNEEKNGVGNKKEDKDKKKNKLGKNEPDVKPDFDVNVPQIDEKLPDPEMGASVGAYDYTWVKIAAGTLGTVSVVTGSVIFVIKMRGILYKWDYNTRRRWHF